MFDLSFAELLLVAIFAIVVIGPQEMPRAIRWVGGVMRSLREVTSEIRTGLHEVGRVDELQEVERQLEAQKRYIIDEAGNYQEVHDISEFLQAEEGKKAQDE